MVALAMGRIGSAVVHRGPLALAVSAVWSACRPKVPGLPFHGRPPVDPSTEVVGSSFERSPSGRSTCQGRVLFLPASRSRRAAFRRPSAVPRRLGRGLVSPRAPRCSGPGHRGGRRRGTEVLVVSHQTCSGMVHRGAPCRGTEVPVLETPWCLMSRHRSVRHVTPKCSVVPVPLGVRSGPPRRFVDLQRVAASSSFPCGMGLSARGDRA